MDHDRLFKELLTTFFWEFVEAFLPEVAGYLDRDSVTFLDKEVFTDVTAGERHEVDLVAQGRFKGHDSCFLVHVEQQAQSQADFGRRMFRYFARLYDQHGLPVYPVVVFSHDQQKLELDHHEVRFPDRRVLDFRYRVIQLRRLSWRRFVNRPNPVVCALMSKMRIAPADRPRVKLECLRLLTTLRLDPARVHLISGFIDTYLHLNAAAVPNQVFFGFGGGVFDRQVLGGAITQAAPGGWVDSVAAAIGSGMGRDFSRFPRQTVVRNDMTLEISGRGGDRAFESRHSRRKCHIHGHSCNNFYLLGGPDKGVTNDEVTIPRRLRQTRGSGRRLCRPCGSQSPRSSC